jgi:hypothetical protein
MATETGSTSRYEVGYRRTILVFGALWGAVIALHPLLAAPLGLSETQTFVGSGAVMTLLLGLLYELDSRALAERGRGVPLAWAYSLVVPISVVFWGLVGPLLAQITPLALLSVLVGPPASALLYLWQRGKHATVQ